MTQGGKLCIIDYAFDKYYYHNHKIMHSIRLVTEQFLNTVRSARSQNTHRTYQNAINMFLLTLENHGYDVVNESVTKLKEDAIGLFIADMKHHSASTERLYLSAVKGFYEFLVSENYASPNLSRINLTIKQRSRKPGIRLPQFPRDDLENVIEYAASLNTLVEDEILYLRNMRDRAFIFTLADTGLRVHEACNLLRGDIDWNEGRAIIIGKGNREAVIRFSTRSVQTIKDYINVRASKDGASRRPLGSLPIFCRHDRGAGKKILRITTATGRNIIKQRVIEALGDAKVGTITPHSFRHYFVTTVLRASNNLKLAQELARHQNIAVTQRYAHLSNDELDQGYWEIFEKDT